MPQINLTMEEHQQLTKLVARSYDNNYRNDQFDTRGFLKWPMKKWQLENF